MRNSCQYLDRTCFLCVTGPNVSLLNAQMCWILSKLIPRVHILYVHVFLPRYSQFWSRNTSSYYTWRSYLHRNMCIFIIPVTFAWHLNPPPRHCHAGRAGLRLAVYIEFKSRDQDFALQTPSSWIPVDICVWWLLFQISVTPSVLFRCHLDSGLRFNFLKDYCGNFLSPPAPPPRRLAFSRWSWENAWQTDTSITCNVVTVGSRLQMRTSMCESRSCVRVCVYFVWFRLD